MININNNPITHRYDRSPSKEMAAVRVDNDVFDLITGSDQKELQESSVKFSDGGYGRLFAFNIAGSKKPLQIFKRVHKVSESDFGPRTMFYVKHEDVPETAEEMELKTGTRKSVEIDF